MNAGHASLIARLDDKLQKKVIEYVAGTPNDRWHETPTTSEVRRYIQTHIYEDATATPPWKGDDEAKAVFEGCEECRGTSSTLFGQNAAESCSNPKCFAQRMAAYIALQFGKNPSLLKLSGDYSNDGGLIGSGSYHVIGGKKDGCEYLEKGIVVMGRGLGQTRTICRAPECKKHWAKATPGGHYKPTPEERAARKKEREKDAKKKAAADKRVLDAVAKVTWPMSEKHLDALFELVFRRFGYSYLQPVAARHDIQAIKTKSSYGYVSRNYEKPLSDMVGKDKTKKLQLIFEIALETRGSDVKDLKNL